MATKYIKESEDGGQENFRWRCAGHATPSWGHGGDGVWCQKERLQENAREIGPVRSKEQKITSHQAALVIGGIHLINIRTLYGQHARRRNTEKMSKGTAATARAKGGVEVEGWRT
jgi:hypothetical protein